MEEAWLDRHPGADESVHLRLFPELPKEWRDTALEAKWDDIRTVRKAVTEALEPIRREKTIGSSLEAAPVVTIRDPQLWDAAEAIGEDVMAEICITSQITLQRGADSADDSLVSVVFKPATGRQCVRSRRYFAEADMEGDISKRDAQALRERAAAGL